MHHFQKVYLNGRYITANKQQARQQVTSFMRDFFFSNLYKTISQFSIDKIWPKKASKWLLMFFIVSLLVHFKEWLFEYK